MANLLLKGAPAAKALTETLRAESDALRARGVVPTLALVRLGERDADLAYERGALKRCELCGVAAMQVVLPADVTQEALRGTLAQLRADPGVHGILLFQPLPEGIDRAAVCAAIAPEKDVDGVSAGSMASIYANVGEGFAPCTAAACVALLKHYNVPLDGKRVVVVGRSFVIGRPVAMLLLRENATVTVAHTHTRDLSSLCREADVLIVATGKMGLIGAEHVRPGQTVVDVGIHATPDGSLCGDVRFDEVEPIVDAITPVPGGVGSMTTAMLCAHVIQAAKKSVT